MNVKLNRIVHIIIAVLFLLFISGHCLINSNKIQQEVAQRIVHIFENTLETNVDASSISVVYPCGVIINNLVIYDQKKDSLASFGSIALRIKVFPLLNNKLSITSARLLNPNINLYKDSINSDLNCQFIINKLNNSNKEDSRFNLRINSIILKNGSIGYNVKSTPETKDMFNTDHLQINNISVKLSLKTLEKDSLNLVLRKLVGTEKSGLGITQTKGFIAVGPHTSNVHGFYLDTQNSRIEINRLFMNYGLRGKNNVDAPRLSIDLKSIITGADFKALYPELASMTDKLELRLDADGDIRKITVSSIFLQSSKKEISLNGRADILNVDSINNISIENGVLSGSMSPTLYTFINKQLAGFGFVIPKQLRAVGNGTIKIDINGGIDKYSANASINSDGGLLKLAISNNRGIQSASIDGKNINLRSILNNENFDKCDISLTANRDINDSLYSNGYFKSVIGKLTYNGYHYRNIEISGKINNDTIKADLQLNDENAKLALASTFFPDNQNSSLSLLMAAENINLKALNLNNTDSAVVSVNVSANVKGDNVNNFRGNLLINNATYDNKNGTFPINECLITIGDIGEGKHLISVISDFLNVSMIGNYNTTSIPASLMTICNQSLPTLFDWISNKTGYANPIVNPMENTFMIDIRLQKTDLFKKVFNIPLSIENTASMQLYVNDFDSIANLEMSIPDLIIGQEHIENSLLFIGAKKGICSVSLSSAHSLNENSPTEIKGLLTAFDNTLSGSLSWKSNKAGELEGSIFGSVEFQGYDKSTNWIKSIYNFDKSQLTVNNIAWDLSPSQVAIDSGKIIISNFDLSHANQYVRADGTISADSSDVMNISLQQININELFSMFRMNNLDFMGIASGNLSASAILNKPVFQGELNVNDFGFYKTKYGNLNASGAWNDELQHIDIIANVVNDDKSSTSISGYFDTKNRYLDFGIDANNTDLYFLNPFTSKIFRELRGTALGKLRIYGSLGNLNLEGETILENGYLDQAAINTAFIIKRDTLWFEPNKMIFKDVEFYDENGHDGVLTCIINHNNLHDFAVDMNAYFADMQILDIPKSENSSIFAKVFAEGYMTLNSNSENGLTIEANAQTTAGTQFGYNLSSGNVSDYNFLKIVDGSTFYSAIKDSVVAKVTNGKKASRLNLNIEVDCTEDAEILLSMNNINGSVRGEGNISARFNSSDGISLNGIYNVSRGLCVLSLENLIRKNFNILEDSYVRFTGKPSETELNFHTYYSVNSASIFDLDPNATANNNVRVRCLMDITGQVQNPALSFDIDMPQGTSEEKDILAGATSTEEQRNMQFMYLLAVGKFYTYDYSNEENVNGLSPNAMESIINSTVNNQINNILSQVLNTDILSLSSNVTAGSYLYGNSTNLTNKELEGILEARLLNNRLLVNGNFGYRENALTNTSNFVGDFEAQWLLLPKQGISIKGYSKNNDKYFSKTTLTTQGVGVVYKKDFDNIIPRKKSGKTVKSKKN